MKIGGFVKNSFVDYPGNISAVIFTCGCNMNCWYCHNQNLLKPHEKGFDIEEIMEYLRSRKGFLDGVVISGGEPTLHPDLKDLIIRLRDEGFKIKLDTNGTNFKVLKNLCDEGLIDFVAMDIKAPFDDYSRITQVSSDMDSIKSCVRFLIDGAVDYEFRTTLGPNLTPEDIIRLAQDIKGAKMLALQNCRMDDYTLNGVTYMPHKQSAMERIKPTLEQYVDKVILRGF